MSGKDKVLPQRSTYESNTQRVDGTNIARPGATPSVSPISSTSTSQSPLSPNESSTSAPSGSTTSHGGKPFRNPHTSRDQEKEAEEAKANDHGQVKRAGGGESDFVTTNGTAQSNKERGQPGKPFGSPEKGGNDMNLIEPGPAMAGDGTADGGSGASREGKNPHNPKPKL